MSGSFFADKGSTLAMRNGKSYKVRARRQNMSNTNNLEDWKPSDWVLDQLDKLGMTVGEVKILNRRRMNERVGVIEDAE